MYYASVDCLELPVRTLAQIRRTQKFLAEVDLSLYPVLPYIEFLSTAGASDSEISIFCPRTETVLAEEMSDQLTSLGNGAEMAQFTHEELYEETLKSTYVWSLGFNPQSTMCTRNVPEHFKTAVKQGDTWITRVFEYEAIGKHVSKEEDSDLWQLFWDTAIFLEGDDWGRDDIGFIVWWLEENHRYL
jgi:hypothetical protein